MKIFYEIIYFGIKVTNNLRFSITPDIYLMAPALFQFDYKEIDLDYNGRTLPEPDTWVLITGFPR